MKPSAKNEFDLTDDHDHVMVDVETMGRKPGCAVLSIGAVRFNTREPDLVKRMRVEKRHRFYAAINNLDSSNHGFSSDPDTMRWWKRQDIWRQLSVEIMTSEHSVAQSAEHFSKYLDESKQNGKELRLWANSPGFDVAILRALYGRVGVNFPVSYRQEMDFRTIMELAYPVRSDRPSRPEVIDNLPAHHALGDAHAQASLLMGALDRIGINRASRRDCVDLGNGPAGTHMMLEVKTLGKSRNSGLLSIAAVIFDPTGRTNPEKDPGNRFYLPINSFDMGNYGFGSDPETIRWWKSQPIWPELSMETVQSGVTVLRALKQLSDFMEKKRPDKVWANSPVFDIEMLRDAYTAVRLPFPITYRQEMDFRTVMECAYPKRDDRPSAEGVESFAKHHALGDALGQCRALMHALNRLDLNRDALARPEQDPKEAPAKQVQQRAAPSP